MQEIQRCDLLSLRRALSRLGLVIAECDEDLRYVWIDNPHPDFDAGLVIGKRDDELIARKEARQIMALKREVLTTRGRVQRVLAFERSEGVRWYSISGCPLYDGAHVVGVVTVGFDVSPPNDSHSARDAPGRTRSHSR